MRKYVCVGAFGKVHVTKPFATQAAAVRATHRWADSHCMKRECCTVFAFTRHTGETLSEAYDRWFSREP